ncbi:hypothetical protein CAter10_1760 [Collimonas arenae]|nr:DUF2867 domain-containing protein [Collimonas arenae]AMO99514.1 hypothetical protein CAter10_1760 [Collimonas arenae]
MSAAVAVAPPPESRRLLPGHDFADAYQVATSISGLDARQAADAIIKHPPSWIKGLMTIRNRVVKLFRLRTVEMGVDDPKSALRMVGGFPIVSQSSQEVILGFDDKHLDFRISIVAAPDRFGGTQVTVATLVKPTISWVAPILRRYCPFTASLFVTCWNAPVSNASPSFLTPRILLHYP